MRTFTLILVVTLLLAQAMVCASELAITASTRSKYIGTFSGGNYSDDPIFILEATKDLGNDLYAYTWAATSLNGKEDGGEEIDIGVGKVFKIGGLQADLSASYFAVAKLSESAGDCAAYGLVLSPAAKKRVRPSLAVQYCDSTDRGVCPDGTLYRLRAETDVKAFGKPSCLGLNVGGYIHAFGNGTKELAYAYLDLTTPVSKNTDGYLRVQAGFGGTAPSVIVAGINTRLK